MLRIVGATASWFRVSGLCATLGRCSLRRGLQLLGCAAAITAVTLALGDRRLIIWFGVLHCLGICMMLWPLFRKLPWWGLGISGSVLTVIGLLLRPLTVEIPWLFPLGLTTAGFSSSDYFPLLPNLGFFLLGAALGRVLYREKTTRLPNINPQHPILRFFGFCGRASLPIYLLHQPVLSVLCLLLSLICNS